MNEPQRLLVSPPGRGVSLAVYDWGGTGRSVFCTHATGFCGMLWQLVAEELAGRMRVIAWDVRGHGDSSAPEPGPAYDWEELARDAIGLVEELCSKLGLARIDLGVGNSMGGAITLAAAARRPELFGAIALIDPVVLPEGVDRSRLATSNPMAEGARKRRSVFESRRAVVEAYRGRRLFADWQPRALELYAEAGFRERADGQVELKCAGEVEAAVFSRAASLDPFPEARALRVPGVLLHAARGDFAIESYQRLAAQSAQLRVESLASGHLAPMIDPALVAQRLRALS
jgi:pimeloyl-ACP methyl ester carboxylesterase